ncbi:hypothetical protein DSM04_103168 [Leeuwenhoekiella aestuarii]|uniref:Uncharacterized protein n=1 Tax=Leeuwenhoekiella aestuarii TaxID=2249426 RepID=A0A4Q0NWW6_9FLAO|nr:hypothetical protein DSM04_103168 [Leeuwenhoekiella aestuarii]
MYKLVVHKCNVSNGIIYFTFVTLKKQYLFYNGKQ